MSFVLTVSETKTGEKTVSPLAGISFKDRTFMLNDNRYVSVEEKQVTDYI